ncbi:uncharacterized protein [Oryza sativa Japonica Group]|jgi:hypothetical protein|uniref:Os01g0289100 protein n=3 Tax=Oryza TaxID=4527 RepID=A0A0P0V1A7_ORYSJ|nr:uncharacterized protein LOC107278289 [Oryza sativa Japonica Group]EEC70446.1 hypothetical protein OsI_01472 [Oryza sativa Indica Group]KAB8081054.1 hypothetical protein EE612_001915 [Oryza sativa]KAF2949714.1 hypothetical protein DAI22_01g132000 [Oryza sativa Japonica Group]BAS71644.1 Os01g0289100 [Oryza sativa Japonica Group]
MGRGKKRSVFAFLFGFKSNGDGDGGRRDEAAAREQQGYYGHQQHPWGRTTTKTKVWPSDYDDDNYYGRQWYAERDIDRRASEFIDRVHRGMLAGAGGE